MTNNQKPSMLETVLGAFEKYSEKRPLTKETKIRTLGLDSLDMVEVGMAIEQDMNIEIPDEYMDRFSKLKYADTQESNEDYNPTIEDFSKDLEKYLKEGR